MTNIKIKNMDMYSKFTRDPPVEKTAVEILGIPVEEVLSMRIQDVRALVKDFADRQLQAEAVIDAKLLSRSEIVQMPRECFHPRSFSGDGTKKLYSSADEVKCRSHDDGDGGEEEDRLLVPINVTEWCRKSNGLQELQEYIELVLARASALEASVMEKHQVALLYGSCLDDTDLESFGDSVLHDKRDLSNIYKWSQHMLDGISGLIRERMELEDRLRSKGNSSKLLEKLHHKTLQLKNLHGVLEARMDCLRVPP